MYKYAYACMSDDRITLEWIDREIGRERVSYFNLNMDTSSDYTEFSFLVAMNVLDRNELTVAGIGINMDFLLFPLMTVSKMLWQQKCLIMSGKMW